MKKRYLIAGVAGFAGAAVAVQLLSRPQDVELEEHKDEFPHSDLSRFVDVEGVKVHFQEAGPKDGTPLILVHGFTASNLVWSEVILKFAERGFHVIAPDLIGFGYSGKPRDGEYTIDAHARSIIALMDRLGIERATLVGSSYGGAISSICALDFPNRVERLVLVGSVSNDDIKRRPLLQLAATPILGDVISALLLGQRWLVKRRLKRNHVNGQALFDDARIDTHHRPLRTVNTQRAALAMLRQWSAERITQEAHLIDHSTLLIWGDQDNEVPVKDGERLLNRIPNSRLVVFRHCGHLPHEDYPNEFSELVADFVTAGNGDNGDQT